MIPKRSLAKTFNWIMSWFVVVVSFASANAQDPMAWPQFRGPTGMGLAASDAVVTQLDDPKNLRWRTDLLGTGWSSPVFDGQRLWVTSATSILASPESALDRLANDKFADSKDFAQRIELFAIAIDSFSGEKLFEQSLAVLKNPGPIHSMNSFASPTPTVAGNRIVCHFGSYGTWCLDASTAKVLWSAKMDLDESIGPASSPIITNDLVILTCDGIDQQYIAALDINDGKLAWKTQRPPFRATDPDFNKAYCTPLLIDRNGNQELVILGAQWIVGYDPSDGRELWRADYGNGFSNSSMPIFTHDLLIFSTGFAKADLTALKVSGHGQLSSDAFRWRTSRGVPEKPSLVFDRKQIYLISDDGILTAVSIESGSTVWQQRLGGTFSASPLLSGENIFLANHEGQVFVGKVGNRFKPICTLEIDEQIMASPIALGNDFFIRSKKALYRFGTPEK